MKIKLSFTHLLLLVLAGLNIYLLTKIIYFPQSEIFIYPYLTNNGLLPYKDIFDQHFPGLMFLPINFNNLGMLTPRDSFLWSSVIVSVDHMLLFTVGKRIFKSEKLALLGNLIFLAWQPFLEGYVLWIDNFLPLMLLPAFYFSYTGGGAKSKGRRLFLAGLFLGVATLFKQVIIPLAVLVGVVLLIKTKSLKKVAIFALGYLPAPLLMVFYFWNLGIWEHFWYWTVVYNVTVFADYGRKYPHFSGIVRAGFVFAPFGVSTLHKNKKLFFWLAVFLFGSLAAVYARFDFVHLQPALPFVVLGSVLAVDWARKKGKILVPLYAVGALYLLFVFYLSHSPPRVLFFEDNFYEIAEKVEELTDPGEHIFVYGVIPHIYQISETLPAGDVFVFQFPWFLRVTQQRLLDGIVQDEPNVIVYDGTVTVAGEHINNYMADINAYIQENYETIKWIGDVEIKTKK